MKLGSDQRFFLAIGISFAILLVYPKYLKLVSGPTTNRNVPSEKAELTKAIENTSQETAKRAEQSQLTPPALGPATEEARKENRYQFANEIFKIEFTDRGAGVRKLKLREWKKGAGEMVLVDSPGSGSLTIGLEGSGADFTKKIWALETLDERSGTVSFTAEEGGLWRLRKIFRISAEDPSLWVELEVENLAGAAKTAKIEFGSELATGAAKPQDKMYSEAFVSLRDKLPGVKLDKAEKKAHLQEGDILWGALTKKYFAVIVRADRHAELSTVTAEREGGNFRQALRFPPENVEAGGTLVRKFEIYAGPQYYRKLKALGFEQLLSSGFFGAFKLWLLVALEWTYKAVHNYGWAIVLITLAIKLLFTPLTHMSFESMKKMQALQPKLKALQERYKNDQAKLGQETMDLYKRHKVNPMSGCLPMLLQIPIFIAFYNVLAQTVELKGEPFILWMKDLSEPDRFWTLPFSLPFLGDAINILPLLMIGSMVWQQKLTPQTGTAEQQKMMMIMPIVFGFIFYSLPSGLVLYWFVNNLLSIFHQLFIKGKALPHLEESTA